MAASIVFYPVLAGLALSSPGAVAMAASTFAYMLSIYTVYGIARFASAGRNYLLWGVAAVALIAGYLITGVGALWPLITAFSLILFAGVIAGRMTAAGSRPFRVYLTGLAVAVLFAVVHYAPQFRPMMTAVSEWTETFVEEITRGLINLGYGADAVRQNMQSTKEMLKAVVRVIPAMLILSAVLPYSIGYLVFAYREGRKGGAAEKLTVFERWKMPFAVMPVVIVAVLLRLLSSGTIALVADNILACLAFYYVITGLALMEYYLRRYLPNFLRVMFYISFFISQFIGLLFSAIMLLIIALLGFIDSFLDWRKVQQLSLEEK
ncbi:MAG: DUF2232 domain-containing protein [Candidatus Zixiibacteriota bacterium]